MSLVLYRKYRPQTFAEIVGQEHVVRTLTNAISSGMISHAYLFAGPRGSGKTTVARLLAKAVNCQKRKNGEFEPCNQCSSCQEIMAGRALDLIEIDAASHRGIDEIRDLKEVIGFVPSKLKYKVFVIDECQQLTKEAANALLKTLEEPPSHAIFVLATTEVHKMIPTIISRCQRFDFRKLTSPEIIKKLEFICQKEKIKVEKHVLELIASNSEGSIRDAEGFLDQVFTYSGALNKPRIEIDDVKNLLGLVDINLVSQLVDFISQKDKAGAINFLNQVLEKGKDPQEFIKALIDYLHRMLILKIDLSLINPLMDGFTKEEQEKIRNQAEKLKEGDLRLFLKLFLEAENKTKYSSIPQLPLELAIVEVIETIS